jgi:gamma-glutamylcyclotransferase (GGCT)/AIG2-like uncharacterized protein YtfP
MTTSPAAIFVYGTLKRGEVRERMWPRQPLVIEPAEVRGALYDLGPYPALAAGDDRVAGELWHFAAADLPATLAALDRIEGYRGRADDLYKRIEVRCQTTTGAMSAWTYCFAEPHHMTATQQVRPGPDGLCRWPNPSAPVAL